ncbi:hypothetical protein [Tsuneonella sp. SYSU-LHT278]|uniref:hypothetical protein n=1 Tax=Tsuneonella sediminis TaxID=3416089 RepID=UPI003F790F98
MREILRAVIAVTAGVGVLLFGQLAIENAAWWWTGGTSTFDDPLLNLAKFAAAGAAGLALAIALFLELHGYRNLP